MVKFVQQIGFDAIFAPIRFVGAIAMCVVAADVIYVRPLFGVAVCWREHSAAVWAAQQSSKQVDVSASRVTGAPSKNFLDLNKGVLIDKRRTKVFDAVILPDIYAVLQSTPDAAIGFSITVFLSQHAGCAKDGAIDEEKLKHFASHFCFSLVYMDSFVFADAIPKGHLACDDFAFAAMPIKNVTDAVARLVALMLSDREFKIEEEAAVCGRCIKVLLRALPKHVILIKDFLEFIIVGDIPEPPIEAFKHDNIYGSRLHVLEEPLQASAATEGFAGGCTRISVNADADVALLLGVAAQVVLLLGETVAMACLFLR